MRTWTLTVVCRVCGASMGEKTTSREPRFGTLTHGLCGPECEARCREEMGRPVLTDGRWRMAAELAAKHPDVTRISHKWDRWQHHVDYSQ